MSRTPNIINGEWFPADWIVDRSTDTGGAEHVTVYRPGTTGGMSPGEAVILRDLLTTRSKSVDRDKRGAAG